MRNKAHVSIWEQHTETHDLEHVHYGLSADTTINALSIHDVLKVTRKTRTLRTSGTKVTTILVHTPTGIIEIDCFNKDIKEEV